MSSEQARSLIKRRMDQAEEALADAGLLLSNERYRAAINRSYYAMFYAVLALLILSGKGTSKHSGAIAMFDLDFIKDGAFDKKFSRWLHEAFEDRLRSDYKVEEMIPPEEVAETLRRAKEFVEHCKEYLADRLK
ncbi:MAG TPA: HEPN domain-containing protein [bacterium]|nr:HEPN domain-containing protein [bacterium]